MQNNTLDVVAQMNAAKAQIVRVADIFVLGPLMIYLAVKKKPLNGLEKKALMFLGTGTILYNFYNWSKQNAINKALAAQDTPAANIPVEQQPQIVTVESNLDGDY